jgi:hypothetical protein
MDDSLAAMRKRPAPASGRRIVRARDEWTRPASHDPGADYFNWEPELELIVGVRKPEVGGITRKHFVSEALDDRKG